MFLKLMGWLKFWNKNRIYLCVLRIKIFNIGVFDIYSLLIKNNKIRVIINMRNFNENVILKFKILSI